MPAWCTIRGLGYQGKDGVTIALSFSGKCHTDRGVSVQTQCLMLYRMWSAAVKVEKHTKIRI